MKPYASLAILACIAACGQDSRTGLEEAPNPRNDPSQFGDPLELRLDKLPTSGKLAFAPWSDTYWPTYMGGLLQRWNATDDQFRTPTFSRTFPHGGENGGPVTVDLVDTDKLKLYSKDELKAMSEKDIAQLSPVEKYDIWAGNYNPADPASFYVNTKFERQRTDQRTAESWEGICHGWSPASINFSEPAPVVLTNRDGIRIPFGSADLKALLSYVSTFPTRDESPIVGDRCYDKFDDNPRARESIACRDANPMAAHVIFANYLGRLNKGFVVDVTTDAEVWNQPVYGFSSKIQRGLPVSSVKNPAPGTKEVARVTTDLTYRVEVRPTQNVVPEGDESRGVAHYEYFLELDAGGKIIGGEWISKEHLDFLWRKGMPEFSGAWAPLKDLLAQAGVKPRGAAAPVPPPPVPAGKDKIYFSFWDNTPFAAGSLALMQGSVVQKQKGHRVYVYDGNTLVGNAFVSLLKGTFTIALKREAGPATLRFVLKDRAEAVLDEKVMKVVFTNDPTVMN